MQTPYGFLIRGATFETRRLVDATAALVGFAGCDPRAKVRGENYLSAFWFGADFRDHLKKKRFDSRFPRFVLGSVPVV